MPKDDRVYLGHMLDMAREARELVLGIDRKRLPTRPDSQISPCALDPGVGRNRATSFQTNSNLRLQPSRGKTLFECAVKLFTIIWP